MSKILDVVALRKALKDGAATSVSAGATFRFSTTITPEAQGAADSRVLRFVFSDGGVDRYLDTVNPGGWDLKNFLKNPVCLFGHDSGASASAANVIGRCIWAGIIDGKLVGDIEFMTADLNPVAETVFRMLKGGYLNAVSVGFMPIEYRLTSDKSRPGGIDFIKQELLEISVVPVPALASALVQARAAGIDVDAIRALLKDAAHEKSAGPVLRDLWHVSFLASILADLGFLEDMVEWEAEIEGDGSTVPQQLADALKLLGQALIDLTVEEVTELIGGEGESDGAGVVEMSAVARARVDVLKLLAQADEGAVASIGAALEHHLRGFKVTINRTDEPIKHGATVIPIDITGPGTRFVIECAEKLTPSALKSIRKAVEKWQKDPNEVLVLDGGVRLTQFTNAGVVRAGKVLSAENEKALRGAHDQMTNATATVKGLLDQCAQPDEPVEDVAEQNAADAAETRRREAAALKIRHELSADLPAQ